MIRRSIPIGILAFSFMSVSCASTTPYNPFKVEQDEFFKTAKIVALGPVFVPADITDTDEAKTKFESAITAKLTQAGFSVIPSKEYSAIWKRMTEEIGGYFDPVSGKRDEAKFKAVREHSRREVSTKFNVDTLLFPRIQIVKAEWKDAYATWDGTTESVQSKGDIFMQALLFQSRSGTVPALSLVVFIEDLNGRSLYAHAHGLQVLTKFTGGEFVAVPQQELFQEQRNLAAIDAVLKPLVNPSKLNETALTKP